MIATGIDIHGEERGFDCTDGILWCQYSNLISLTIPEGVRIVRCNSNQLTTLILPVGIEQISCDDNQLTELKLPEGVTRLFADKEVPGLEKYIGTDVGIFLK